MKQTTFVGNVFLIVGLTALFCLSRVSYPVSNAFGFLSQIHIKKKIDNVLFYCADLKDLRLDIRGQYILLPTVGKYFIVMGQILNVI